MFFRKRKKETEPRVFYACDRKACETCEPGCSGTSDVNHAVNFEKFCGCFLEIDKPVEQKVDHIIEILERGERPKEEISRDNKTATI